MFRLINQERVWRVVVKSFDSGQCGRSEVRADAYSPNVYYLYILEKENCLLALESSCVYNSKSPTVQWKGSKYHFYTREKSWLIFNLSP